MNAEYLDSLMSKQLLKSHVILHGYACQGSSPSITFETFKASLNSACIEGEVS